MTFKHVVRGIAVGTLTLVLGASLALADQAKEKNGAPQMDAQTQAMMAEMAKYAAPGPEHKILDATVGKWKMVSKAWMGPGEPAVTEGTAEWEWILGGRFLVYRGHGTMMGQPFEGFEVLGYDRKAKGYVGFWADNMGTGFWPMSGGTYDEATKALTFNVEWPNPMGPGTMPYKMVTKILSHDSHVFTMSTVRSGKEMTEMEITYTRAK